MTDDAPFLPALVLPIRLGGFPSSCGSAFFFYARPNRVVRTLERRSFRPFHDPYVTVCSRSPSCRVPPPPLLERSPRCSQGFFSLVLLDLAEPLQGSSPTPRKLRHRVSHVVLWCGGAAPAHGHSRARWMFFSPHLWGPPCFSGLRRVPGFLLAHCCYSPVVPSSPEDPLLKTRPPLTQTGASVFEVTPFSSPPPRFFGTRIQSSSGALPASWRVLYPTADRGAMVLW